MPIVNIRRILYPVDLSPCSQRALTHALGFARWYAAPITVLHVFEVIVPPPLVPTDPGPMIEPYPTRDALTEDLARFVDPLKDAAAPMDLVVEEGHVARTIAEAATRLAADLLVIGTHGRGGTERLMLGSVAEKVLRRALSPVLVVPPAVESTHPTVHFSRILCPVDFDPPSLKALTYALSLAQEASSALTVVHVLEPLPPEAAHFVDVPEYRRRREQDARNRLRAVIPGEVRDWCRPVEVVAEGKPYREILRLAAKPGPTSS